MLAASCFRSAGLVSANANSTLIVNELHDLGVRLIGLTAAFGVATVYSVCWTIRHVLDVRRGRIVSEVDRIKVTDWRGREKHIHWDDIEGLHLIHFGGLFRPPRIVIKTSDGAVKLSPWLQEPEQLVEEIIDRARLHDVSDNWFATRYLH